MLYIQNNVYIGNLFVCFEYIGKNVYGENYLLEHIYRKRYIENFFCLIKKHIKKKIVCGGNHLLDNVYKEKCL